MSKLTLIVAATKTNGIGKNSRLPWRLPNEMAYFARVTSDAPEDHVNAVIMGRNTWESIPSKFKPLKGRANVVISRNPSYQLTPAGSPNEPCALYNSLESALEGIRTKTQSLDTQPEKAIHRQFIIGGAALYCESLAFTPTSSGFEEATVDRVLLTRILSPHFEDCDVFMPHFLAETYQLEGKVVEWRRASHEELQIWVGFEVPAGIQEERGVQYEFQMWVR